MQIHITFIYPLFIIGIIQKSAIKCDNIDNLPEFESKNDVTEYRGEKSIIIRVYCTDSIAKFISDILGFDAIALTSKHSRKVTAARSLYAALLRCFCDYKCRDLCKVMGNITQGGVPRLCTVDIKLIQEDEKYKNITHDFIVTATDSICSRRGCIDLQPAKVCQNINNME